ncbi:hypothetical protein ACWIGI_10530 [Nocardia sp. NPDC055321]
MVRMYYAPADSTMLAELTAHRHVVEILELLSESGCATALFPRLMRAPYTELISALDLLATHGLLAGDAATDWNATLSSRGTIRLSDQGEAIAEALSNPSVSRSQRYFRFLRRHAGKESPYAGIRRWGETATPAETFAIR